jgi:hypothetical protein
MRGADGCDSRTRLTWLREHSQGEVESGGTARRVRASAALCICHFFVVEFFFVVRWAVALLGGFPGFYSPCGANKPTPLVAGNESGKAPEYTYIPYPPRFSCHLMPAVDPSIPRNNAYIPRWRGEAVWWSSGMYVLAHLSSGNKRILL